MNRRREQAERAGCSEIQSRAQIGRANFGLGTREGFMDAPHRPHRLVDGMNVIGSRPDGWWRDRDAAVRRLHARLGRAAGAGERITLVLDGDPVPGLPEGRHGGIDVLYARRGGADAADDRVVELVREAPQRYLVVTSDRGLRDRVSALGGETERVGKFLEWLERLQPRRDEGVRRMPPPQLDAVVAVLSEAFEQYPVIHYVLGDVARERGELLVRLSATARVLRGEPVLGVEEESKLVAAALVSFPDGPPAPQALADLRTDVWSRLGADAAARYQAFVDAAESVTVDEPHVHLNMVGVLRAHRGRGLAARLIDEAQRISRERPGSRGVTLTTEDPANVSFYLHLGFEMTGHARVAPDLESWGFFRPD